MLVTRGRGRGRKRGQDRTKRNEEMDEGGGRNRGSCRRKRREVGGRDGVEEEEKEVSKQT